MIAQLIDGTRQRVCTANNHNTTESGLFSLGGMVYFVQ